MKHLGGRFISPVFTISLLIFLGSCLVVEATGGVGPCGPASSWGLIWFIGYPVGFIGMVVGLGLSAFRTYIYFTRGPGDVPGNPDIKNGH